MSYSIRKNLSFEAILSEKDLTQRLMSEVRYLIRSQKWKTNEIRKEMKKPRKFMGEATEVKSFFFRYRGKEMLAMILFHKTVWNDWYDGLGMVCVFSDDYVYTSRPLSVNELWDMHVIWDEETVENLRRFDAKYPRFGLAAYLDRYEQINNSDCFFSPVEMNFLIPMFAHYHKGLELLVKAGLYHLAKTMLLCDSREELLLTRKPETYRNLKEWLGVSHNVLKKLDSMLEDEPQNTQFRGKGWWYVIGRSQNTRRALTNQEFFARLADIGKYNSAYLNLKTLTPWLLRFFMENHFIHHKPDNDYPICRQISGVSRMKDFQVLKVIRYIEKLSENRAYDYMQYLNYCGKCKEYTFGLVPTNPEYAAMIMNDTYGQFYASGISKRFRKKTQRAAYQFLQSDTDANESKEKYCVLAPREIEDLLWESNALGHCVKDYGEAVANGETYILFLREKDRPNIPYVTMEVTKNFALTQVKARYNESAEKDAQEYVRKWAKQKDIRIDTDDLSETA